MPSRWFCLVIVAFWLSMTGWLLWKDVWPNWEAGQPPPFTIDMEEEAAAHHVETTWNVYRNGEDILLATTWVKYQQADDTFALRLRLKPRDLVREKAIFGRLVRLEELNSVYRINRRGELQAVTIDAVFVPRVKELPVEVSFRLNGEVMDGYFQPNLEYTSRGLSGNLQLSAVPVSHHGTVFLPLHPVQRIEGLRFGQTWRMPMLNVVEASINAGDPVIYLNARVLPQTQTLPLDGKNYECLIIEYRGENHRAQTWIEERTGLVLRQEQIVADDNWAMQRISGPH